MSLSPMSPRHEKARIGRRKNGPYSFMSLNKGKLYSPTHIRPVYYFIKEFLLAAKLKGYMLSLEAAWSRYSTVDTPLCYFPFLPVVVMFAVYVQINSPILTHSASSGTC
ncbi:hypothetical protein CIPAW_13G077300 [Carya illinoinensis]|uniref:Uncharacterized protein n=1 Tax=Carya illinoinensis TaxID=32201 RepID=A0A8T1NQP8_CARIL|nr:hypothetical protein CIPAW_13G077300 [Carya illinoinensis]